MYMYTMYFSTQHLNQHGGYQVYTISTSCQRTVQSIVIITMLVRTFMTGLLYIPNLIDKYLETPAVEKKASWTSVVHACVW